MNYKSFNLGDWIGHISGVIEDESELDGNEMRDLVEFLSGLPRWIPVSERLPEIGQRVIATIETLDGLQVRETVYDKYGFLCGHGIAWQPLPEPYKAEKVRKYE